MMPSHQLGLLMPHPPIIVEGVSPSDRHEASATIQACEEAAAIMAAYAPETLVLVTPHGPVFRDAVALFAPPTLSGDLSRFGAATGRITVPVDLELAQAVIREAEASDLPIAAIDADNARQYRVHPELDHGAYVPLSFLLRPGVEVRLLHLTYGLLPSETLFACGQAIRRAADRLGRRVAFLASGDLSHRLKASGPYGFDPAGPELDRHIVAALSGSWSDRREALAALFHLSEQTLEHAAECGLRSLQMLLGYLDTDPVTGRCLSYEGPFGVGYAVCVFETPETPTRQMPSLLPLIEAAGRSRCEPDTDEPDADEPNTDEPDAARDTDSKAADDQRPESPATHPYASLARQSLEHYLASGSRMKPPPDLDPVLFGIRRGCFVSIHKHGELRGCIGTMQPTAPDLAREIIGNALSAGLSDPRFPPITQAELPALHFSVDVLSELEPATRDQLDPHRYGVLVRYGSRSGVLLPDLEGVDTVEEQLGIALRKGGIRASDPFMIERFTVDRYPEPE